MEENQVIPIIPGGMLSDVVENDMPLYSFPEVVNVMKDKQGRWTTVNGYADLASYSGFNDIKAAIEINDQYSGDRFILFQSGQNLCRVDYDSGDGNGYENESPTTLTLPSGVTIGPDAVLRFFINNGEIRITGASEPLWYSYINKTLFPNSIQRIIDVDSFESDMDNWTASGSAVLTRTTSESVVGSYSLQIANGATIGSGRKDFTTTIGKKYVVFGACKKNTSGGSSDVTIRVGDSPGGWSYFSQQFSTKDSWFSFRTDEFVATSGTATISIDPTKQETCFCDAIYIIEVPERIYDGWYLLPAALKNQEIVLWQVDKYNNPSSADWNVFRAKHVTEYDSRQFSLAANNAPLVVDQDEWNIIAYKTRITIGTVTAPVNERFSGVSLFHYTKKEDLLGGADANSTVFYYLLERHDFTEEVEPLIYARPKLYYNTSYKYRLYFDNSISDKVGYDCIVLEAPYPCRIIIKNSIGELDTFIVYTTGVQKDDGGYVLQNYVEFADKIAGNVKASDTSGYLPDDTVVWFYWKWEDLGGGIIYKHGFIDINNLPQEISYNSLTEIPDDCEDNSPNYSHIQILEQISYVLSLEAEEGDAIRYSPIYQPDNLPIVNIFQTETGNFDSNKALIKKGNRIIILKNNSIEQGSWMSSAWYSDINKKNIGMYPTNGYILRAGELFIMEYNTIYRFDGVNLRDFLEETGISYLYKQNVTTSSFFLYNKKDNELWVLVGSKILRYSFRWQEWYMREMGINPIGGYLDAENNLIVFSGTKFYQINHTGNSDEVLNWRIVTKIYGGKSIARKKQLKKIYINAISNNPITIIASDDTRITTKQETVTLSSSNYEWRRALLPYLYNQLKIEIKNSAGATDLTATLKEFKLVTWEWT